MIKAYRNLNKKGVFYSIKEKDKPIRYVNEIWLRDVRLKHATPAALKRIRSKHREVCAWVNGIEIIPGEYIIAKTIYEVLCDPKYIDTFSDALTKHTLSHAEFVHLSDSGKCFYFKE